MSVSVHIAGYAKRDKLSKSKGDEISLKSHPVLMTSSEAA